ncbi:MAG: Gfo/Idh/MocA family oxidoreductase [Anaerolineae bacterium]|nr:Gfo/Idh/MocA family oxidoreductase [Anaerolineae bacterium]
MTSKVGIGLVGVGAFGRFCLDAFQAMDEVSIAAVADVDKKIVAQAAEKYHATGYDSLDALVADPAVEIVALNTPPYLHGSQGLAVLKAGKHLFCEKPLAVTVEEGQQLLDAAAEKQLHLTVDYVMRQNPFWGAAAKLARSGVLGPLRHMDLANHAAGLSLPTTHWFWDARKSGGIWIEHGVHFFDAFAWVAGTQSEVLATTAYQRADGATDRVEALLRYGDVAAHCYHAFDKGGDTEQTTVILTFERGYVTLREWVPTSLELLTNVDQAAWRPFLPGVTKLETLPNGQFRALAYDPDGKSALYRRSIQAGMRDLARTIRHPDEPLAVTGEAGLTSLRTAVECTRPLEQANIRIG